MTETKECPTPEQISVLRLKHEEKVRTLSEAKQVAEEIGLLGQVKLYADEIAAVSKTWRIDHEMSYPEVTHGQARDAFCEPMQACPKHFQVDCMSCRIRDVNALTPIYRWRLWTEKVDILNQQKVAANTMLSESQKGILGNAYQSYQGSDPLQRHASPIMYPMGVLLKLKDALAKDVFDSFECWRPISTEEKQRLEDPWIVGVLFDGGRNRYFKIAEWR